MRRAGTKVRVTAELIAPEKGEQLWNGRYDRDIGDLFAMQDEITVSLGAALAPEIYRAEASAPLRSSSADLTAWDRFLRGLSHYYRQTKTDFEASIALFREAIALDGELSIARAYLATIQVQGIQYGWIQSTRELWAEAMALAETSVRLDPRSSFAFSILSYLHAMEGHHEEALEASKRAVELNPYDMGARGVLGTILVGRRLDVARGERRREMLRDPRGVDGVGAVALDELPVELIAPAIDEQRPVQRVAEGEGPYRV